MPTEVQEYDFVDAEGYAEVPYKPYCALKYTMDFVFACIMLAFLSIPLALIAILVRLDSRGPAIYRQTRIGANGKHFTLYKFRTMKVGTPVLSTAQMRQRKLSPFTRLGPILRKTSLDELPQLFNIVKGQMSFIGPRPAIITQFDVNALRDKYGIGWTRPGITGLAQVMGRDDLDVQTKVRCDRQYCINLSLIQDLRILVWTLGAVVSGRGNR